MGATKGLDFWNGDWDVILKEFSWTGEFPRIFMKQGEIFVLVDK